jgi:hypothetical protein
MSLATVFIDSNCLEWHIDFVNIVFPDNSMPCITILLNGIQALTQTFRIIDGYICWSRVPYPPVYNVSINAETKAFAEKLVKLKAFI